MHGDLRTEQAVIAAAPLGDIVKQHRNVKRPTHGRLLQDHAGKWMVVLQRAFFDPRQQSDRADGVLVDGIMVVHIELHLRDDTAEIGNEPPEHRRLVHPAKHCFRIAWRRQHVEKQGICTRIDAHCGVDQLGVPRRNPDRLWMDFEALPIGYREQFEDAHRVFAEPAVVGDRQPPTIEDKACQGARTTHQARQCKASSLRGHAVIKVGQKHAGQVTDSFGGQKIMLHEAFHGGTPGTIAITHPSRDFGLDVKGQPILSAARYDVQVTANGEQEVFRFLKPAQFGGGKQAFANEFGDTADPVDVLADPEQRMQVAKASLPLLHIGFDHIAAVAHPLMPCFTLGELFGHEGPCMAVDDFAVEAAPGLVINCAITPHIARLQQRGTDRQV